MLAVLFTTALVLVAIPASAAESASLVKDIAPGDASSFPALFHRFQDKLFFPADGGTGADRELWVSDGTGGGTHLFKDLSSSTSSSPMHFATHEGSLYFTAEGSVEEGLELWKSDGTVAGTGLVKDINPSGGAQPRDFTPAAGTLFFTSYGDYAYFKLWKTDGTEAGTVQVNDIGASWLTELDGELIFAGYKPETGVALWKSDGSDAGTVLVKEIGGGADSPEFLTTVGDGVFFRAHTSTEGWELWKTDGTEAGTVLVADINPGAESSHPYELENVGGTLYFWGTDASGDTELWKSDGTEAGTVRVKNINPAGRAIPLGPNFEPQDLVEVGGRLFFHANGGSDTGVEVWTSDGTEDGTHIVEDIKPGGESSFPGLLTDVEGTLYFAADDGTTGYELWRSSASGTDAERVTDVNTEGDSLLRAPEEALLVPLAGALYFGADDGTHGYELWKVPLTAPLDSVPPTASITSPLDGGTYTLGQHVLSDYACADEGGSGLAGCAGTVPDGDPIDTGSTGTKTFTVTATDGAGNSASVSATYSVIGAYDFTGFLHPVDNPPIVNVMPAGKGVKLIFSLGGNHGLDIFETGYPVLRTRPCEPDAPEDKVEKTVKLSASKLTYQPRPDRYVYSWATQTNWRGGCRELVLRLDDGSEHRALFRFS